MARVVAGIGISHTPSMGIEFDRGMASESGFSPRWQPWYDGTRRVERLLHALAPDHLVVVYNDHLNYFDLDNYPTLAIGVGDRFRQADEGWGPRPVPDLNGDVRWGLHLTEHLVASEFDMTVSQDLAVDHGIFSWMPYLLERPWPVAITPIAVNMIRHPLPTAHRLYCLGRAIRAGIESFDADERVVVVSTGGMSHQISGARFGIANEGLDQWFLEMLPEHLDELMAIPVREYMRYGGTEAAELSLWFAMRSALSPDARAVYSFQTFPAVTGCGALMMLEPGVTVALDEQDEKTEATR
ncbi:gallate dioxygenase [Phytohabitans flavus]|uniref:Protocatechuate 4,5-dioxygenase subunit beta n=1 Tax=Phytohabitans flavus TaxID=1076124 RepID=A0A6F8XRX4_9ACTN|nr:protocatechuate 3,4-dioxygenase [Phytohabitans flavus]BCB76584.1 protocatechuate 4,5-dioxygenase subunit beta [Phytohabitans flavus]